MSMGSRGAEQPGIVKNRQIGMFGLNEGMAIFAGGCIGCHIFAMLACLVAEFSVRIFSSTKNFALLVGGGYCWREKRVCDYAVWKTRKSQRMGIVWRKDVAPIDSLEEL
ncbi:hypothetical protein CCHR01_14196 [Colletotrichum chrysophilum]|uniref:Uncharacterized protein n=1 Tax=Colletotrichum chrysophilum TaxID=1836956 RepID=A0AAD9A8G8_9PEZI|nr:hypothetical protein CCHR01_14196 [Colletotrichum chrysophilum]